jgi:hypothetical protein
MTAAEQREARADQVAAQAEQIRLEADMAERAAAQEREAARMHQSRADLHEKGLMDHELDVDTPAGARDQEIDRSLRSERDVVIGEDAPATTGPARGGTGEGRFTRDTDPERTPDPDREPGETRTSR